MMNNPKELNYLNLLLLERPPMPGAATTQVNMKKVSAVIYPPYTKIEKVGRDGGIGLCPPVQ
jgi:hypothetical protein